MIGNASMSAFCPPHQFAALLHQPQLQHLGLGCAVGGVGLRAR
jgi:hypothetical protein